jgi:hypothetical protein
MNEKVVNDMLAFSRSIARSRVGMPNGEKAIREFFHHCGEALPTM